MMSPSSFYARFRWQDAYASHWACPAVGVSCYLGLLGVALVLGWPAKPIELRRLTVFHNLFLSFLSLVMFVGTSVELFRRAAQTGDATWFFCEEAAGQAEGPLYFWSYVYYLSKYYEMLDTALVVLQKSRVPHFKLQVYHHAAVVPMAWLWCQQRQSLQWGGLLFNTLVHVVMYQYYAWRVLGWPTPWKRWITKLQITQFATSFILLGITLCIWLRREHGSSCAGMTALLYNCIFNATLLLQFIGVDKNNSKTNGSMKEGKSG